MSATLTIDLPEDVRVTLGKAAREDGVSENAFAVQALRDCLRVRQLRKAYGGTAADAEVDAIRRTMEKVSRSAKRNGLTPKILNPC